MYEFDENNLPKIEEHDTGNGKIYKYKYDNKLAFTECKEIVFDLEKDIRLALERVIEKKYPIPNATKNLTDKK